MKNLTTLSTTVDFLMTTPSSPVIKPCIETRLFSTNDQQSNHSAKCFVTLAPFSAPAYAVAVNSWDIVSINLHCVSVVVTTLLDALIMYGRSCLELLITGEGSFSMQHITGLHYCPGPTARDCPTA